MSHKVKLQDVRLAFPKLFTPQPVGKGDKLYYSAAFPIDPKSENHTKLEAAIKAAATEKWGAKADNVLARIREEGDISYKHKPLKDGEGEVYDGFQGMYALNASLNAAKGRPGIYDNVLDPNDINPDTKRPRVRTIKTEAEGRPYAGCYVNATVDVWAQDNENGRRVNVSLIGVQFHRDGDAFGGGSRPTADDFDGVEAGATADDIV